jgi:hypothetical protein
MARKPKQPKQSLRQAWREQQAKMAALQAAPASPASRRRARLGGLAMIGFGLVLGGAMGIGFWQAGRIYAWLAAVPLALLGVGLWALVTGKLPAGKGRR